MKRPSWFRRLCAGTLTLTLVGGMTVAAPGVSGAASTTLFEQEFRYNIPNGIGPVIRPAGLNQENTACLTASGGDSPVLPSCPSQAPFPVDVDGEGALSLTPADYARLGGVFATTSVPTASGLDVSFTLHQYSDTQDPADGLTFALAAVDPADPTSPPNIGPAGGSLGYAAAPGADGLANAYLGIGFDVYGYYSSSDFFGTQGCGESPYARPGRTPYQLLVRGPGNGQDGYCALNGTATDAAAAPVPLHGTTRQNSGIPVRILINSADEAITTADGITAPAESYVLRFTPLGAADATTLSGPLPRMDSAYVGSPDWLDADGLPKQLAFGWAAATGGLYMNQEIQDAVVTSLSAAVPVLTVDQTSYTPAVDLGPGDPVTYTVTPGVAPGVGVPGPVVATVTTRFGVLPRAATGNGWSCAAPVERTVTCTNANGPFAAGQQLPPITVSSVVYGAASAAEVQNATVTVAAENSQAGYSDQAPPGTNPATPVVEAISPDLGGTGGGGQVTLSGQNLTGATSVWVGTPGEHAHGAAALLLPCSAEVTTACFTESGGTLVVTQWPAHEAGPVQVRVVALGAAGQIGYTYVGYTPGSLLISEFRMSGPEGAGDDYVELTNVTDQPIPLAGIAVQSESGGQAVLPADALPLAPGRAYLLAGPSYSLGDVAAPDLTMATELRRGGLQVVAPDAAGTLLDAVGPAGSPAGFFSGTGLPAFPSREPFASFAWVRTQQTGALKSTGDNAADFALVSTDGAVIDGVQSMLGSPSPSGLTTPTNRSADITSALLDPSKSADAAPNRVVTRTAGTPGGRIESRRVVINDSGSTVTSLQLRLIDISEANGLPQLPSVIPPGAPIAQLRAVAPPTATVVVNGRTVSNLTPAAPSLGGGGGLNSTFTVPLPDGGLAPGQSATVALGFQASTSGRFAFRYSTEALLAAG